MASKTVKTVNDAKTEDCSNPLQGSTAKQLCSGKSHQGSTERQPCSGKLLQGSTVQQPCSGKPLQTFDALFVEKTDKGSATELPIKELHEFRNHPFHVTDDDDMEELTQSIREKGVLVPVAVRRLSQGGYEIISGHRRCHAAARAGLFKVPAVVLELSDGDAVDFMVYSNIHRTKVSPSEMAFAYRMQMETLKQQGSAGGPSADAIGKKFGENARKIQRYIRLTYLNKDLLQLVDTGKLTKEAGYWISFLEDRQQGWVLKTYQTYKKLPSGLTARRIRDQSVDRVLTKDGIERLILGNAFRRKITLKTKRIDDIFPPEYDSDQIAEIIYGLLEKWKETYAP